MLHRYIYVRKTNVNIEFKKYIFKKAGFNEMANRQAKFQEWQVKIHR
jgi:hypothetical protein